MKKIYTSPEFTAEELLRVDVITASGETGGDQGTTTDPTDQTNVTENAYWDITQL